MSKVVIISIILGGLWGWFAVNIFPTFTSAVIASFIGGIIIGFIVPTVMENL